MAAGARSADDARIASMTLVYHDPPPRSLFSINVKGKVGYIDRAGKVVIEPQFKEPCGEFSGGVSSYAKDQWTHGFIDAKGAILVEAQFSYTRALSEGLAAVEKDKKWGYV